MSSSRGHSVSYSNYISNSQHISKKNGKFSLNVALNTSDDDDDDDDVRTLYWVIWYKFIKNLEEFVLINFMFVSSLYLWVKQLSL